MTRQSLRLGAFTLDLERLCLEGSSGAAHVRPKSFDVLRYLVERAGNVVTKEELIRAIWPDVTVSDESLTQCISEVRRAIGDDNKRIIRTIPRRGYMVDVPVSTAGLPPTHASAADSLPSGDQAPMHLAHVLEDEHRPIAMLHAKPVASVEQAADRYAVLRLLTAALKSTKGVVRRLETAGRAVNRPAKHAIILVIGVSLIAVTLRHSVFQSTQSIDGTWQGLLHCDKLPFTEGPMAVAIKVIVAGLSASYSRNVLNPEATTIIGTEAGIGTVTDGSTINLIGLWTAPEDIPRFSYTASYSGKASGQTADLLGTQEWKLNDNAYLTRNCSMNLSRRTLDTPLIPGK